MVKSDVVNSMIQRDIINGAKVPHGTSQPVIYQENGKYYLAAFVFYFNQKDIQAGEVERPTMWAIMDIETGEILERRMTSEKDFSNGAYDVKYNVRCDAAYDTSQKYYDEAFEILDSCREKIINDGKMYMGEYKFYLEKIVANIPKDYQRFYFDLSV